MVSLSEEQQLMVSSMDRIAQENFADRAFEWQGDIPWENIELLAEEGFLGLNFDSQIEGESMTEFDVMLMVETIGRVCPDTAAYVALQHMVAPRAIEMFGSSTVKDEYLPLITNGTGGIAIAMSEPQAGSDVRSMETNVTEEDGDLMLNGEKIWVSNIPYYDAAVVWVKFPDGLGSIVIDLDWAGIDVAQNFTNMADHTQSQIFFEDVHIPEDHVLTRGREGFAQQLKALNWERLASAVTTNTFALCALEHAYEYAQDREQFDQRIIEFQGIQWKIADMVKKLQSSRALTFRAAERAIASGDVPDPLLSTIAKLKSAEMVEEVVSESLQIHGANGYQQGHPLEYLYKYARGSRIAGGTDEIQKNTIARLLEQQGIPSVVNQG